MATSTVEGLGATLQLVFGARDNCEYLAEQGMPEVDEDAFEQRNYRRRMKEIHEHLNRAHVLLARLYDERKAVER